MPTALILESSEEEVVGRAVQAFEEVGALVLEDKLGITRPQRELSDVWYRLYLLLNLQTFENFKKQGVDLLGDQRDDFPPEYLHWVEEVNKFRHLITIKTKLY